MTTRIRPANRGLIIAAIASLAVAGCARTGPADAATLTSPSSETLTSLRFLTATVRVTSDEQTTVNRPTSPTAANTTLPTLSCANARGIALSLDANFVGQPSPIEAARWFVAVNRVGASDLESAPWSVDPKSGMQVYVTTEGVILEAVQLPNQTWAIASATYCA